MRARARKGPDVLAGKLQGDETRLRRPPQVLVDERRGPQHALRQAASEVARQIAVQSDDPRRRRRDHAGRQASAGDADMHGGCLS